MKIRHLSKKKLSEERLRVRRELDEWEPRLASAVLGAKIGTHTPEQVAYAKAEVDKRQKEMHALNRPRAKQIAWVGHGFKNQ